MLKIIVLGILVGLSYTTFASVDLRHLKKIKSCELVAQEGAVFAGQDFSVVLKIEFNNGAIYYSNGDNAIGFNDFKVTVQGAEQFEPEVKNFYIKFGDEVLYESKKKKLNAYLNNQLDLTTDFELIDHPYVLVKAQLIDYPEISCELSMPVHFNGKYRFYFDGDSGNSGSHGKRTPQLGLTTYYQATLYYHGNSPPPVNGTHGRSGLVGVQGGHGRPGKDGTNINVFVSMVDRQYETKQLVKIEVSPEKGETYYRYLEKDGGIIIYANGGDGGNGGNGADGGKGTDGQNGWNRFHPISGEQLTANNGKGGHGGHGGNGGSGGNAGYGGNGGDVTVFIEQDALFFKDQILVINKGGKAGQPGIPGFGGDGGKRGDGGKGKGLSGQPGNNGLHGYYGEDGKRGEVNYIIWN